MAKGLNLSKRRKSRRQLRKKLPSEGLNDEYGFIELQGDLKSHSETPFAGKFVGDLHYTKDGTPILIIGHHLMYGREVKLEKPLALLEKDKKEDGTDYLIRCIIRKKIIFKTRPKPIVGV